METNVVGGDSSKEGYPRLYRVNSATRRILIGFGILLVSFGVLMSVLHIAGVTKAPLATGDVLVDILFAAFALWISSSVSRRVILHENSIEVVGWCARRQLTREEIRGYRMGRLAWQAGGASYYIVVPLDEHTGELKLPAFLNYDKPFFAWMKSIRHITVR
jgi:hypothetical protein